MTLPARALQLAVETIQALPTGDSVPRYDPAKFFAAVRAFIVALDGCHGAVNVVAKYGDYIEQQTSGSSEFEKTKSHAVQELRKLSIPSPRLICGEEWNHPAQDLINRDNSASPIDVEAMSELRDEIQHVLHDHLEKPISLSEAAYRSLVAWRTEIEHIVAYGTLHYADACSILISMYRNPSASWQHGYLGHEIGKYYAEMLQKAVPHIAEEILAQPIAESAEPAAEFFSPVDDDGTVSNEYRHHYGLLIDSINLGPTPGFGNKFPISDFDAMVVDGDTPSVCPKTDRPVPIEWLPTIEAAFKRMGMVKNGQTIHWVGSQSRLENVCTCFRVDGSLPNAEKPRPTGTSLSETHQLLLLAMLERHAFDSDSRIPTEEIAKLAGVPNPKRSIAELRGLDLAHTKQGRGGGVWLTEDGRARATRLSAQL